METGSIITPHWSSSCPLTRNSTIFFPHSHNLHNPSYSRFFLNTATTTTTTTTRFRRRDSNAVHLRPPGFNFDFRNKDEDDDDEEYENDISSGMDQASSTGLLDEITDNIYIFKVFRSYGWFLPAIISSMLLATGPKAFVLALALPLGQSVLSLAFDKLVGKTQKSTKRKARRTKKKPFARPKSGFKMGQEQEASGRARKGRMDYQSWVAGNAGSVEKGTQDEPSLGGWDELDSLRGYDMGSMRTTSGSRRIRMEKGKLSRGEKRSKTPLLLRLLIAVFPFLGSWTKLL